MKKTIWALMGAMIVLSIIFASCSAGTPNGELEAEGVVAGASENETVSETVTEPTTESTTELTTESTTVTTTKPTTEATTKETTTAKPTTTQKQTTTKKETTTQKQTTTKQETTTKKETTTQKQTTTQKETTTQAPKMTNAEMCKRVWELVNEEREKAGLKPLEYRSDVQAAADLRAKELAQSFSHTRPDGRKYLTVFEDLGFSYSCWAAENAAGGATPEIAMNLWMNSEGHKANILSKNAQGIVVGVYESNGQKYWVQIFNNITLSDEKEFGL